MWAVDGQWRLAGQFLKECVDRNFEIEIMIYVDFVDTSGTQNGESQSDKFRLKHQLSTEEGPYLCVLNVLDICCARPPALE